MKSEMYTRLTQLDELFIRRQIQRLRETDLRKASINRLKLRLAILLRAYEMYALRINYGEPIFRARKHREVERELCLTNVRDVYPQPKLIKSLGRANRKHQCVYYFAADEGIALNEVNATSGDVISVL